MTTEITTAEKLELKPSTLKKLASESGKCLVSIYAPMMKAGREVQQNEIRWKNLVSEARNKLIEDGKTEEQADDLLEPAASKISDPDFWQHQNNGLVFFIDESKSCFLETCCSVEERVVIGESFFLRPIVKAANDQSSCFIIAASPNRVRLFEVSGDQIVDVELESLPENLQDALNIDEYVSALQFHSTSQGSGNSTQSAVHHGHGGSDPDVKKQDELLQYFHRLDAALSGYLAGKDTPLVFAGVDSVFPVYRKANSYKHLVDESLPGNSDDASPQDLLTAVTPVLKNMQSERLTETVAAYQDKAHTDWASKDAVEIYAAAKMGQVDQLFISDEFSELAKNEEDGESTDLAQADASPNLGNLIVLETIRNGGKVVDVTDHAMQNDEKIAAVFRSPVGKYVDA